MQQNRLFEIIYILLNRDSITAKELAERFEVSTRTIFRDIDRLSAAGIPVYTTKGKGGGIHLLPNYQIDKAFISKAEQEQLLSALHALNEVQSGEYNDALKKFSALFGTDEYDWLEIDFETWEYSRYAQSIFPILKKAILKQKPISFNYTNNSGKHTTRVVEPMKLILRSHSWYIYGFCRLRQDFRFFKLSRISDIKEREITFKRKQIPKYEKETKSYNTIFVSLQFESHVASRVLDDFGNYETDNNGKITFNGNIPQTPWLIPLLLSYGKSCTVIEPESLKTKIINEISEMISCYKEEI